MHSDKPPLGQGPILGPDGYPAGRTSDDRQSLEALIRIELNEKKSELSKQSRLQFVIGLVVAAATLCLGLIKGDEWLRDRTRAWFEENAVGPAVTSEFNSAIATRVEDLMENRIVPVENRIGEVNSELNRTLAQNNRLSEDIAIATLSLNFKQEALSKAQQEIDETIRVIELVNSAKSGSWESYTILQDLAQSTNRVGRLAHAAQTDVFFFFRSMMLNAGFRRSKIDPINRSNTVYSVDESIAFLSEHSDWFTRDVMVSNLREARKPYSALALADQGLKETNTLVLVNIVATLVELIPEAKLINPLDKGAVRTFRARLLGDPKYAPIFPDRLLSEIHQGLLVPRPSESEKTAEEISEILLKEPDAMRLRCLRAGCYINLGKFEEAMKDLEYVKAKLPGYVTVWWYQAFLESTRENWSGAEIAVKTFLSLAPGSSPMLRIAIERAAPGDNELRWP